MRFGRAHRWSGHTRAFRTSISSLSTDIIFPYDVPKKGRGLNRLLFTCQCWILNEPFGLTMPAASENEIHSDVVRCYDSSRNVSGSARSGPISGVSGLADKRNCCLWSYGHIFMEHFAFGFRTRTTWIRRQISFDASFRVILSFDEINVCVKRPSWVCNGSRVVSIQRSPILKRKKSNPRNASNIIFLKLELWHMYVLCFVELLRMVQYTSYNALRVGIRMTS